MRTRTTLTAALPIALILGLSACAQSQATEPEPARSSEVSVAALTLDDAWVKAADSGMTAVFGTLTNTTSEDLTLVDARFDGAETVELHETTGDGSGGMSMREKEGGFTVPAGQTLSFEPGGNHIMLMGLTRPITPGEEITLDLVTAEGTAVPATAIAKEYTGAQENYAPGEHDGH